MSGSLNIERAAFSQRLKSAIARFDPEGRTGAAWLAREFNQRYGGRPITIHAARKWLVGDAIPAHDKVTTLAGWLRVSAEWLLYGAGDMTRTSAVQQDPARYAVIDVDLVREINALNQEHRAIVRELVALLTRMEGRGPKR